MLVRQAFARASLVCLKFAVLQFEVQVSEPEISEDPKTPSWDLLLVIGS